MAATNAIIYAGGPIMAGYTGNPANSTQLMAELGSSGFTTLVAYTIWIEQASADGSIKDGDLSFNHLSTEGMANIIFVSEGQYQGPADWSSQLQSLKQAGGITKIFFSTLGLFSRIQALLAKYGSGSDSPLYKNFAALKQALPVDGIDLDDEDLWDSATTAQFSRMLHALDYEVSFCPYGTGSAEYWAGVLANLNTDMTPDVVVGFNLQCYDGGIYSDLPVYIEAVYKAMQPMNWSMAQATAFVYPGFWCYHQSSGPPDRNNACPADIIAQYQSWQTQDKIQGLQGGFVYILDSVVNHEGSGMCGGKPMRLADYAASITSALGAELGGPA